MKTFLIKEQIADYEKLCHERNTRRLLTPDGISFICESYNYDAEKIGKHFQELLPKICPENNYD